jgi:copper homeostasis protein (lipoprotein)
VFTRSPSFRAARPVRDRHAPSSWQRIAFVLVAVALGCTSNADDRVTPAVSSSVADSGGTWRGDLPCADCAGIRTTLRLAPDGTYQREAAYLGTNGGGDTIDADVGTWQRETPSGRITLTSSNDAPRHFAVEPDGSLTQRDVDGGRASTALSYVLSPLNEPVALTHPARLTIAFRYRADAAHATECRSGLTRPVAMTTEAYRGLERAATAPSGSDAPVVARVRAHLDTLPIGDGDARVAAWVVDSLLALTPNEQCASPQPND